MQLARKLIGMLFMVMITGMVSSPELHAEILQKTFSSSPAVENKLGAKWHKVIIDKDKKIFTVISLNALGNRVAEFKVSKEGVYSLSRFSGKTKAIELIEQITIDSNKEQISIDTSNRLAFDKWTKIYIEELVNNTVKLKKGTTKSTSDDCEWGCEVDFWVCSGVTVAAALASGGAGGFGMLICYGKLGYCLLTCPTASGESGTGGYTPRGDCDRKGCPPGQKCCDDGHCAAGPCATPDFGYQK